MGVIGSALHRIAADMVEALLPSRCYQCNDLYHRSPSSGSVERIEEPSFEQLFEQFLCSNCRREYTPIHAPLCTQCGLPFTGALGPNHLCGACERHPFNFTMARSAGSYDGALQCLIHLLKYRGHAQAAIPLGRLLWLTLLKYWCPREFDGIVPVPLYPKKLRQRGFNQAALLVREWPKLAERNKIPFKREMIKTDWLIKYVATDPQTGLNRLQRSTNLGSAFSCSKRSMVRGGRLLLIDDVMTTGATADQCARVLLSAGAQSVHVLTLARTV